MSQASVINLPVPLVASNQFINGTASANAITVTQGNISAPASAVSCSSTSVATTVLMARRGIPTPLQPVNGTLLSCTEGTTTTGEWFGIQTSNSGFQVPQTIADTQQGLLIGWNGSTVFDNLGQGGGAGTGYIFWTQTNGNAPFNICNLTQAGCTFFSPAIAQDGLAVSGGPLTVTIGTVGTANAIFGPYADSATARGAGVPIGSLYYVAVTGVIGVVLA